MCWRYNAPTLLKIWCVEMEVEEEKLASLMKSWVLVARFQVWVLMNYLSVVVQTSAAVVAFNFNGPSSGVRSIILYDSVLVANLVAFVCLTAAVTLSTNLQSANAILGRVGSVAILFWGFQDDLLWIIGLTFIALLLIFLLSRTYQASG